jgi:regulator of protease activity HflC (stomatin/prohibitin superfamily)
MKRNVFLGAAAILAVAFLLGGLIMFQLLAGLLLLLATPALVYFIDRYVWVRIGEMEAAVVFNQERRAFSRFITEGRHLIRFPFEQIVAYFSTGPQMAKGVCRKVYSSGGVNIEIDFAITFVINPYRIEPALRAKMARALPANAAQMVRTHASNIVSHLISEMTIEDLYRRGVRPILERSLHQRLADRLLPFGIELYRVMVTGLQLPPKVQTDLEQAHRQAVQAAAETRTLSHLHEVVSRFSDEDMARLVELRRLQLLGDNGVMLAWPTLMQPRPFGHSGGHDGGGNGRGDSPVIPPPADGPSAPANWPKYT